MGTSVGRLEISHMAKRHPVHTPDITVADRELKKPLLVLELDGKSHESSKSAERDRRRDRHYEKAGIFLIVLNSARMRCEKRSWQECVDDGMKLARDMIGGELT